MTENNSYNRKTSHNTGSIIKIILTGLILIFSGIIMFTGSIKVDLGKDTLHATAWFSGNVSINYADIENISYEKNIILGRRNSGIGNFLLQAGVFKNDTFGNYQLYSYRKCKEYVVIKTNKTYIVINDQETEKTRTLYYDILDKIKSNIFVFPYT